MSISHTLDWTSPFNASSPTGRTAGVRIALVAVATSAALSGLLCSLTLLYAVLGLDGYRSTSALLYTAAFAAMAYSTWQRSRAGAVGALVLYFSMHHSRCGYAHLAVHSVACSIYFAAIWSTVLLRNLSNDVTSAK